MSKKPSPNTSFEEVAPPKHILFGFAEAKYDQAVAFMQNAKKGAKALTRKALAHHAQTTMKEMWAALLRADKQLADAEADTEEARNAAEMQSYNAKQSMEWARGDAATAMIPNADTTMAAIIGLTDGSLPKGKTLKETAHEIATLVTALCARLQGELGRRHDAILEERKRTSSLPLGRRMSRTEAANFTESVSSIMVAVGEMLVVAEEPNGLEKTRKLDRIRRQATMHAGLLGNMLMDLPPPRTLTPTNEKSSTETSAAMPKQQAG